MENQKYHILYHKTGDLYVCKCSVLFCLQNLFKKAIIGTVVLTDYNNRTYRVDDVDFDVTPKSKFEIKPDVHISYIDYYLQVSIFW
jgi:hypothetical protein